MTPSERLWRQLFDEMGGNIRDNHFQEFAELAESGGFDDVDRLYVEHETIGG